MNLKRIRIYFRNALLIALSMIVVAGATGLSYQVHYCHDKISGIAFYTELGVQKSASCGCADDKIIDSHSTGNSTVLKKTSCCSDITFFKKLTIINSASDFSQTALVQPAVIAEVSTNIQPVNSGNHNLSSFDFRFRPPPLAGRKLVLFLSQQRIPVIIYNC